MYTLEKCNIVFFCFHTQTHTTHTSATFKSGAQRNLGLMDVENYFKRTRTRQIRVRNLQGVPSCIRSSIQNRTQHTQTLKNTPIPHFICFARVCAFKKLERACGSFVGECLCVCVQVGTIKEPAHIQSFYLNIHTLR